MQSTFVPDFVHPPAPDANAILVPEGPLHALHVPGFPPVSGAERRSTCTPAPVEILSFHESPPSTLEYAVLESPVLYGDEISSDVAGTYE